MSRPPSQQQQHQHQHQDQDDERDPEDLPFNPLIDSTTGQQLNSGVSFSGADDEEADAEIEEAEEEANNKNNDSSSTRTGSTSHSSSSNSQRKSKRKTGTATTTGRDASIRKAESWVHDFALDSMGIAPPKHYYAQDLVDGGGNGDDGGEGVGIGNADDDNEVQDQDRVDVVDHVDGEPGSHSDGTRGKRMFSEEGGEEATKEHFSKEEFGDGKIVLHDRIGDDNAVSVVCAAVPRQYFVDDVLHREKHPRKVSWDELFLDLLFIAIISQCEKYLKKGKENITWTDLNHFALVFTPVWMTWLGIHHYSNRFGTYDMFYKFYIWIQLMLAAGMGINAQYVFGPDGENTGSIFCATFLLSRLLYMLMMGRTYFAAPQFGPFLMLMELVVVCGTLPFFISLFLPASYRPALWWTGFLVEQFVQNVFLIMMRRWIPKKWLRYRFAFNIEHHAERFGLLTLIVLGEVVVAILWDSEIPSFSWNYVATVCALVITISMQWIYYNVDGSRQYTHALRRSVPTAVLWQTAHYPLHVCTVAAGAALSNLLSTASTEPFSPPEPGVRYTMAAGLALSMFCLAIIGLTHRSHDSEARFATKLAKKGRMLARLCVVVGLTCLAVFGGSISNVGLVGIAAGLMLFETVLEEWGRLKVGKPKKIGNVRGKGKKVLVKKHLEGGEGKKDDDEKEVKGGSSETMCSPEEQKEWREFPLTPAHCEK
ncbi:hypothetical protein HDU76_003422 [Blyttiomyces sp. JEL0837]|nr:hypothetical protein HDU76_003422 [Blyttiomyces sp. JEL0837]